MKLRGLGGGWFNPSIIIKAMAGRMERIYEKGSNLPLTFSIY
jgi:hypothetical protein